MLNLLKTMIVASLLALGMASETMALEPTEYTEMIRLAKNDFGAASCRGKGAEFPELLGDVVGDGHFLPATNFRLSTRDNESLM